MSSTFEKSVKGATKLKLAPPKSKYIEHILQGTRAGEAGVAEVFRILTLRLRDSTWTIAFKALIVIHLMIREGEPNVTLRFLSTDPRRIMSVNTYTDVQTQGRNIKNYAKYIQKRASGFEKAKVDYVLSGTNRLKLLSIDKGLLRETELVQDQIQALVQCDLLTEEIENNEITLTAFRLLTMDLLILYQVMNEGTISVLERYFEMSRPDAERALKIYKTFTRLTESVVRFLAVARANQQSTRLEIPKLRHAPTSLAASLEEYLNDQDFETNRQQYIAQQQAKRGIKPPPNLGASSSSRSTAVAASGSASKSQAITTAQPVTSPPPTKGPAPDLIDFFDSIEQNQQPMAQNNSQFQQQQSFVAPFAGFPAQTGYPQQEPQFGSAQQGQFAPQQTGNPFMQFQQPPQPQQSQYYQQAQLQNQYTGAGFGGYGPQPVQQVPQPQQYQQTTSSPPPNGAGLDQFGQQPFNGQEFQQAQEQPTNPFRKSTMPNITTGQITGAFSPTGQQTGTNPFARSNTLPQENTAFGPSYAQQPSYSQTPPPLPQPTKSPAPLQAQQTGTNPFARNQPPNPTQSQQPSTVAPGSVNSNPTGNTNPFKNSAFVNQQTGLGWQASPQNSMGGLETMDTIPVFPRPGQPQQQGQYQQSFPPQQQQNQSPWL